MVILCDSVTRPWIETLRMELAPTIPTVYIEKALTDYDHYKLNYSIISTNRKGNSAYNSSRNTISYCLTTTLKFIALKLAEEAFPEGIHYWWIDFGCAHIAERAAEFFPSILATPHPKVSCAYIHYRLHSEVVSMEDYLRNGNPCSLAATIFSVQKEFMAVLFSRAMSVFHEMLAAGVGHNEEAILVYLYDRFPEMFHLYYGDYYSTVCNYHGVYRDYPPIRTFLYKIC